MTRATFEISYQAIANKDSDDAADALQLLKTFAFLHCENIRFEFLEKAVTNAALELQQQAEDKKREAGSKAHDGPQTWSKWWNTVVFSLLTYLYRTRTPLVLPDVLRQGREQKRFSESRHGTANGPLVIYNHTRDSYSMHLLVHEWAREAPDMSIGEQGVWSEATSVLLSSCILLPPLGNTTKDEDIRKDLLPHVDHVREVQACIADRMKDKRMARMKPWPVFESGFNRERALMYAKFSIVYSQNDRWEDAKRLQMAVKEFTLKFLGIYHPVTRRIMLPLAGTLFHLGHSDEAAALHEQSLGRSRYLQGRLSEARKLQEEAVARLQKLHGLDNEATLDAVDNVGRTTVNFYREEDFRRARS
ncbi:hypothetical protein LTR37_008122 [Vermiconidia calcicola]|uniref:Uncharacterized protein n=1 Tax=Vermiconidia calcicola TaxID=1690605 RepID=A0ACC3NCD6_9PEZI|nr:hypothetical protein LTR37_008122 [Vermiconidia calcicola]